jgi:formylglycine-generating enzyme
LRGGGGWRVKEKMSGSALVVGLLVALVVSGCGDAERRQENAAPSAAGSDQAVVASASGAPVPSVSAASSAAPAPVEDLACGDGMVHVAGDYCPEVEQICLKHHPEWDKDQEKREAAEAKGKKYKSNVPERCLAYRSPSVCVSKQKRSVSFCVDRYEYPNQKGELPRLLISWTEAKKKCEAIGKRLCTEEEFNFACEGPEMLPYTYGYERDATKCSIDKEYRERKKKLFPYEKCMTKPLCKEHLAHLDQRLPAGSMETCKSPFGVYDMNGNINEWVEIPKKQYPDRSGLKGGWWGPVRGRCRPTVDFHKEDDYGYEEGFRCCKDAPK